MTGADFRDVVETITMPIALGFGVLIGGLTFVIVAMLEGIRRQIRRLADRRGRGPRRA